MISDAYIGCTTAEEFRRRMQLWNLVIWLMMGPIEAQDYIDKERGKVCQQCSGFSL